MRHLGRDSIRPWPRGSTSNACYSVGDAVDAWWCDAWWEGVVISSVPPANDTYRVYFPGISVCAIIVTLIDSITND